MQISNFTSVDPRASEDCSICMNPLTEDVISHKYLESEVHHCFHERCLKEWALTNLTCPLCRYNIVVLQTPNNVATVAANVLPRNQNRILNIVSSSLSGLSQLNMCNPLAPFPVYRR